MSKEKSVWQRLGYLILIVILVLVIGVVLGVVYPWFEGRVSMNGSSESERVIEHGHSHQVYDHTHSEIESGVEMESSFEKAGYEIGFSKPKYENDLGRRRFVVGVRLINNSFEPYAKLGLVCDVSEKGQVVVNGRGVNLSELKDVYPGEELDFEVRVSMQNASQWVSACRYTPTGAFEESKTVEVDFEEPS